MSEAPLSIFFLIRSLALGGAQRQLVQLASGLHARGHKVQVATFYSPGPLMADLRQVGVPVVELAKRGRWDVFIFLARLRRAIIEARADVIYSFEGGSNIFSALVRPFVPPTKLVWSVRGSNVDLAGYTRAHRLGARAERRLAPAADLIISNSEAGRDFAISNGFPTDNIAVVQNGIDTERFRPDAALRREQRAAWGLGAKDVAVGMLARLDLVKGHVHFLAAAAEVASKRDDVCFVCVGDGTEEDRLKQAACDLGIADRVIWPGPASDPVAALNGLDLFCQASTSEGFPNAVCEAMACGLPCIVTNVGDSATIVGDCGIVVPPSDPNALASAILEQIDRPRAQLKARQRIVESFSIPAMIDQTLALLRA